MISGLLHRLSTWPLTNPGEKHIIDGKLLSAQAPEAMLMCLQLSYWKKRLVFSHFYYWGWKPQTNFQLRNFCVHHTFTLHGSSHLCNSTSIHLPLHCFSFIVIHSDTKFRLVYDLLQGKVLQGAVYSPSFISYHLLFWLVGTSPICNAIGW